MTALFIQVDTDFHDTAPLLVSQLHRVSDDFLSFLLGISISSPPALLSLFLSSELKAIAPSRLLCHWYIYRFESILYSLSSFMLFAFPIIYFGLVSCDTCFADEDGMGPIFAQGFPDCGKTRVASAVLGYFMSIGMPIIARAATNMATDSLAEKLETLIRTMQDVDADFHGKKVIRVYANPHRALLEKYRDEKYRAAMLLEGKSVKDVQEEEERVYAEVTEEEDREMLMINKVLDWYNKNVISCVHSSLQVCLVEHAKEMVDKKVKLLKAIQASANPGDKDEDDSDDEDYPESSKVDIYSEFVAMFGKAQQIDIKDWEKDEKKYFHRLQAHVKAATIANTDCVIFTASIMGSDVSR